MDNTSPGRVALTERRGWDEQREVEGEWNKDGHVYTVHINPLIISLCEWDPSFVAPSSSIVGFAC